MGCQSARPDEPEPEARQALRQQLTLEHTITIQVPQALVTFAPVLAASHRLVIGSHAVIDPEGAPVTSLGETLAKPDASLNDIWSHGPLELRDRVLVRGSVYAANVTAGHGVIIEGEHDPVPAIDPPATLSWQITYPQTSNGSVQLNPSQTSTLAPGRYTSIRVGPNATLKLSSGVYYVDQAFELESQGTLELDQSAGPITLYVDTLRFRGAVVTTTSEPPKLSVVALGSETVFVEQSYQGALLVPASKLVLRNVSGGHTGYFAARELEVDAGAQVHYRTPLALLEAAGIDPTECLSLDRLPPLNEATNGPLRIESASCDPACNPQARCSGHGTCTPSGGPQGGITCVCNSGWKGTACEVPELAPPPLSNGPAPPLDGPADVDTFLDWLFDATIADLPQAVGRIYPRHGNEAIGTALVNRFNALRNVNSSHAVMVLSALGELRTNAGYALFVSLLAEPLPPPAPDHGENPEQHRLLGYQIRSVHGIGYLFNPTADGKLLELAEQHPSRVIRAQAIRTYTFHQNEAARDIARATARPEEQWLVDRFENRDLDSGKTFDERLQDFTTKHPELLGQPAQP